ncbi:MAG TPA: prepilin-type N-terminal cleavage/methylation domain-containing protein [Pseudobdellovibrionaceae bacterium]|nr:prepilin-type N-terminal cleavage/methylation domain-containing protein [Pseudobdellovibrionaceae bacterium]
MKTGLISNDRGFSLVEVLMALGVLAMVTLGVGVAVSSLMTQQQRVVTSDIGDNFSAAFFQHLLVPSNCTAAINGRGLPAGAGGAAFTVSSYRGFQDLAANIVQAGAQVDRGLFVSSLTIRQKPGTSGQIIQIGDVQRDRRIAQVILKLERRIPNEPARPYQDRILEIPVLLSGGAMEACQLESDAEDLCLALGGTYQNDECIPPAQCSMKGTYIQTTCSDNSYGCAPEYQGADRNNSFTKTESCPAGSCPTQSGRFNITRSVKTGKKSSKDITVYENFYICMSCPGMTCPGAPPATKKN